MVPLPDTFLIRTENPIIKPIVLFTIIRLILHNRFSENIQINFQLQEGSEYPVLGSDQASA